MIRGIIFDCFGVLYGGSLSLLASMAPEGRAQEVHDINMQKDYGFISYDDYLAQTAGVLGIEPAEVERIISEKHVRNLELVDYVRSLKQRDGVTVAMLSNIGEQVIQDLFGAELDNLFDTIVLSYQEGIAKPSPEIFTLTAERMNVPVWECVMIDDLEANCDGAEIAGMQSIRHITNESTIRQVEDLLAKSA